MAGEETNLGALTEADTCRLFVTPALHAAGWGQAPTVIGEQRTFTDGRIIVTGGIVRRGKQKRADPKDLVAAMRAREQDVMRLLAEIEALVSESPVSEA